MKEVSIVKRFLRSAFGALVLTSAVAVMAGCGDSASNESNVGSSNETARSDYLCDTNDTATYGSMLDAYDACSPNGEITYCQRDGVCSEETAQKECELSLEFHNRVAESFDDGIEETESEHEEELSFTYAQAGGTEQTVSCEATTT